MKNTLVSVLIPTKNRSASLVKTLDTLKEQSYKNFEVVIADGGSTDATEEIALSYRKFYPVRFLAHSGTRLSEQMNTAWKNADGEIVIRTDDDVLMSKDWLKAIVETFEADPKVGGVTGPTVIPDDHKMSRDLFHYRNKMENGNLLWKLFSKIYFNYFMEGDPMQPSHWFKSGAFSLGTNFEDSMKIQKNLEVNNLEACNWSVRKELLAKIGGFDETYVGIGEYHEPDASFKIMNLGYKLIFNPKAMLNHCPSKDGFFKDRPSSFGRAQNFIKFYLRHIRPNTLDKALRFTAYLTFLNLFWVYKFFETKQMSQLGSLVATPLYLFKGLVLKDKNYA